MAVGFFGPPSVFSILCMHLVKGLMVQAFGGCEIEKVASPDALQPPFKQSHLFHHDFPEPELIDFLVSEKVPIIVFLNSAEINVYECMDYWGAPFLSSMRHISRSFSALEYVATARDVFPICSLAGKRINIRKLLISICSFINLDYSAIKFSQLIEPFALREARDGSFYLEEQLLSATALCGCTPQHKPPPSDRLLSPIKSYGSILELAPAPPISWPCDFFITKDDLPAERGQRIALLGPARSLVCGPYFGLPKGRWTATMKFSVFDNLSGNKILVDICHIHQQEMLVKGQCGLPASGSYSCDLSFEVKKPHQPIDIRLSTAQGAIEGELEFMGITLKRHGR